MVERDEEPEEDFLIPDYFGEEDGFSDEASEPDDGACPVIETRNAYTEPEVPAGVLAHLLGPTGSNVFCIL